MTDADVVAELVSLRRQYENGQVSIDEIGSKFERLVYLLHNVDNEEDSRLRLMISEIEIVRFGNLPETQISTVVEILSRAEELFDAVAHKDSLGD